jgi:hypothetical protein
VSEQKWYIPYYNENGQIGFAFSANASQLSTWTKHSSPVIEMTTQQDGMQNVVFPINGGGWAALVAIGGNGTTDPGTTNTKVKLVTSHVEADKIAAPLRASKLSIASKLAIGQNLSDLANKTTATETLLDSQAAQAAAWDKLLANLPTSAPVAGGKPWNDNGVLSISLASAPIITGTAYPGETLTSDNVGVWTVGGVEVSGTSDSYTVLTTDIGKAITQTAQSLTSDSVTVWHPADEAGVKLVLLADRGVFISTDPDVPVSAHLDSVAVWRDQTNNAYEATQATPENRPAFRTAATDGNNSLQFATSALWHMTMSDGALDLYRNINYGYMIASVIDTNLTGPEALHYPFVWSRAGSTQARLALTTRDGTNFSVFSRATDGGNNTAASSPQVEGWNVITSEGAFVDGFLRIRVNGEQTGQTALPQAQATPDTASDVISIGKGGATTGYFPGRIACLIGISGSTALSTAALARLERYAGLLIGKNIPLA